MQAKSVTEADSNREAFGRALVELAKKHKFFVLDADVAGGTGVHHFRTAYPKRYFNCGIAEQSMVCIAAGLQAETDWPVFVTTFAAFGLRAWEHIRLSIGYCNRNVKVVCSHPGLDVGPDGASAQSLEDLACFRAIPKLTVVAPADPVETARATEAILLEPGPVYMRTGRSVARRIYGDDYKFKLHFGDVLRDGCDVTIFACGVQVARALDAAAIMAGSIEARVVNVHTIKPLDYVLIHKCAEETGCFVVTEDHNVHGGLGSAIMEAMRLFPVPTAQVGVRDQFGQSGEPEQLAEAYGLSPLHIVRAARSVVRITQDPGLRAAWMGRRAG